MKITRNTTESQIMVKLDFSGVKRDCRSRINTPLPFLSHMLEQIVWRSGINIEVDIKLDKFDLAHVVCEDTGITIGKAFAAYLSQNSGQGIIGFSDAFGMIDEAKAHAMLSFENRAYYKLDVVQAVIPAEAEGMYSEDLSVLLEGFSQGAGCTLQVDIIKGVNAHHIWEAVFRAFGAALGGAMRRDAARRGMTAGVAGEAEYIIGDTNA